MRESEQEHHQYQDHHDHHQHHAAMIADFRRRFWVSVLLTIPILLLSPLIQSIVTACVVILDDEQRRPPPLSRLSY